MARGERSTPGAAPRPPPAARGAAAAVAVGALPVTVCPLCGALVVAHGAEQHEQAHAAGLNGGMASR
jgi:hypothetical protein